jgi:hypothetical protein
VSPGLIAHCEMEAVPSAQGVPNWKQEAYIYIYISEEEERERERERNY